MSNGIIYLAKNKISSKSYVGQTIRTLEIRKEEHFKNTTKGNYKFSNALKKYPTDSWEWSILAEVPIEELDKTEAFFIRDLDTFKNGYNTLNGEDWSGDGNPRINRTVYDLWHPDYGVVSGTLSELRQKDQVLSNHLSSLVSEKRNYIGRYVLLKNKDKYDEFFKLYEFYHPSFGTIKCSAEELFRTYPQYFDKKDLIWNLTCKKVKYSRGWVLAENKDRYEDLEDKSKLLTLQHPQHGILTMRKSQWKKEFGLSDSGMTFLQKGKYKSTKGWFLVNE